MSKFIRKKELIALTFSFIFFVLTLAPLSIVAAQSFNFNNDSGLNITSEEAGFATGENAETVDSIIGTIIYAILGLVGVIFFGLIIFSGVKWMTSNGNEETIKKAQEGLINAIIGLVITIAAYAISYFLISYFI
ncbi:MAG: Type secretion system pilin [Patescibacteria group bacterium]|nr:Type secretion system pilin [Patescibacteria group bacterium]